MFHPCHLLMLVFSFAENANSDADAHKNTHIPEDRYVHTWTHIHGNMQDNTHANTQILYLLLQSERNHTTLFFWCVLQTAGAAARNAAINACNMPWIRALQLFELESADLITYNTAIEASDWQQAEGRISTRDGYYDTYMILFFVLLPRFMVFLLATGLLVTSLISCHYVVRAVLFGKGAQIRSENLWGTFTSKKTY